MQLLRPLTRQCKDAAMAEMRQNHQEVQHLPPYHRYVGKVLRKYAIVCKMMIPLSSI